MRGARSRHRPSNHQQGRPLRFLVVAMTLWVGARIAIATDISMIGLHRGYAHDIPTLTTAIPAGARHTASGAMRATSENRRGKTVIRYSASIISVDQTAPSRHLEHIPILPTSMNQSGGIQYAALGQSLPLPQAIAEGGGTPMPAAASSDSRAIAVASISPTGVEARSQGAQWSGSAWIYWRDRGNAGTLGSAGQLGGSQAGVRIDRKIADVRKDMPVSLYGRLTTALERPHMPEAAVGLGIKPVSGTIPLFLGVERRIALDHDARNAFALFGATGLNPVPVGGRVIAEGYVQAGLVGFSRKDAFVDGRMALGLPIDDKGRMLAGLSLSGGAQPGISRLDIGPAFQWRLPLKHTPARLIVEWRQRIAGNARPGSGPSITLASDF